MDDEGFVFEIVDIYDKIVYIMNKIRYYRINYKGEGYNDKRIYLYKAISCFMEENGSF